jgi:hypothetical protein
VDGVTVSREALHARLHPPCAVERCTAALHAGSMTGVSHGSRRGGRPGLKLAELIRASCRDCSDRQPKRARRIGWFWLPEAVARSTPSHARRGAHATSPDRVAIETGMSGCAWRRSDCLPRLQGKWGGWRAQRDGGGSRSNTEFRSSSHQRASARRRRIPKACRRVRPSRR